MNRKRREAAGANRAAGPGRRSKPVNARAIRQRVATAADSGGGITTTQPDHRLERQQSQRRGAAAGRGGEHDRCSRVACRDLWGQRRDFVGSGDHRSLGNRPGPDRQGRPERLADLPRQLQVLALQHARSDQCRQRQEAPGRLDASPGARDPRPAVVPAGRRRRALLLGLVQPAVRAECRDRRGDLVVHPGAQRGPDRDPDPHALQPRHRARPGPRLRRHGRRPPDRGRHEDRQAGLGHRS